MTDTPEASELDDILNRIVSQEAITEGGWAEYTTDKKFAAYGNPLHNQTELKQAILEWSAAQQASLIESLAKSIWEDEQKCQAAVNNDPTDSHFLGRLLGLQRARDILEAELRRVKGKA